MFPVQGWQCHTTSINFQKCKMWQCCRSSLISNWVHIDSGKFKYICTSTILKCTDISVLHTSSLYRHDFNSYFSYVNMEFIKLDLRICIDLIVINTAFMLQLQRSRSFLGIVLVTNSSLLSLPSVHKSQEVPGSCRMRLPCVPPHTAPMRRAGTNEHFVYPRRKSTLNGFQNMHVPITSSCVREGEIFTKYVGSVHERRHAHGNALAWERWAARLFGARTCSQELIRVILNRELQVSRFLKLPHQQGLNWASRPNVAEELRSHNWEQSLERSSVPI